MGIRPYDGESIIANEVRRTYAEAELRAIEAITRALKRDKDSPVWAQKKLQEISIVKSEVNQDVIEYLKNFDKDVADAVEKAYKKGQKSAEVDLRKVDDLKVEGTFSSSNRKAVEALAKETVNKLDSTHLRILRSVDDVYRKAVAEATRATTAGAQTRLDAAQSVLNKFANRGVTGFVDEAGRNWNLSSYAEMATRSSTGRAAINGMTDRIQENDKDLVIVSDHGDECELCRPWERRVLSISGKSDKYPSLSTARNAGLFHPNCRHTLNLYTPGLTENVGNDAAQSGESNYQTRQKQRYNERNIRKWKRRKVAALNEKEEQKARSYISKWQKRQRELVDENDLRRKYEREQINQAR